MAAAKKKARPGLGDEARLTLQAEAAALKGHHTWLWREYNAASWAAGEVRRAVFIAGGGPDTLAMKYRAYALLQRSYDVADRLRDCEGRRRMVRSMVGTT